MILGFIDFRKLLLAHYLFTQVPFTHQSVTNQQWLQMFQISCFLFSPSLWFTGCAGPKMQRLLISECDFSFSHEYCKRRQFERWRWYYFWKYWLTAGKANCLSVETKTYPAINYNVLFSVCTDVKYRIPGCLWEDKCADELPIIYSALFRWTSHLHLVF